MGCPAYTEASAVGKSPVREHGCLAGLHGRQDGRSTRQKQLRDREVRWEGSRSQTCEPTNRNALSG